MDEFARWVTANIWAPIGGLLAAIWALLNTRIGHSEAEINRQRDNIAKIYTKIEEHTQRDEDMYREILQTVQNNHSEIMNILARRRT